MGLVQRFDRKLESTVGDAFARVFGGSIVPQEVEGMLRREAADGVRSLQGGRLLAPNEYVITLSVPDYENVIADPDLTSDTFAKHLEGYIGEQGWQTYGEVVVRFAQSRHLHTGQVRARGVVNPDADPASAGTVSAPPRPDEALTAEPGVPMTDNPSYRGGQGQGRPGPAPGDEYYDERYGHPQDEPRAAQAQEQGGYPPQGDPNYPPRPSYPDQGGYPPQYEQRPPAGYGPPSGGYPPQGPPSGGYSQQGPPSGGYDQGAYRQPPAGGYPDPRGYAPQGPPPGYGEPPRGDYNYGPDYGRPAARPGYPDQGYEQGYPGGPHYGRPDHGQPDYGRGYPDQGGYGEPPRGDYNYGNYGPDYGQDYGQPPAAPGGYAGYGQGGEYQPAGAPTVTLQLDDGSGRTYQLREGANVIGRGQDAQFRLPDTGVSRRHLEIRWDGQVALLSDLNSTNGTTVNNAPVQEWQLADGDVIRLGHSEIVVRVH